MQRNEFPLELVYGSLTSSTNLFALRKSILIHCEKKLGKLGVKSMSHILAYDYKSRH